MKYNKYKQILKINIYIKYKGKFAYNQQKKIIKVNNTIKIINLHQRF